MTTVAFRAGIMACDSCWTYGGTVDTHASKIVRLKSGALLGSAGDNDGRTVQALLENVKRASQIPTREQICAIRCDYLGLLVLPKRGVWKIATTFVSPENWTEEMKDDLGAWEINGPFAAIGSGAECALGAMAAGATAKVAVQIACKFDPNSRLPIYGLRLDEKK